MNKVTVEFPDTSAGRKYRREQGEAESNLVHYDGVALIGSSTLCGHTDWNGADFVDTTKRVNCAGCIAVRNHVLGRK